jgi:hypothetical protein
MVEFAQRPMVQQGMNPSTPDSMGTGITSGLVEPPAKVLEEGMMSAQSAVENLHSNLDKAESYEDVMDSIRGDAKSMEQRVNELAGLVGDKDAKKTPKSVLAVMQPYMQILQIAQSQAKDAAPGGIAEAPLTGG